MRPASFAIFLAASAAASLFCAPPPAVDFQRQVRPILSDNCFLCHGPDKGTRMADLRLDLKDTILAARKNGSVVVPGKPAESLIVKRTSSDDPAYRMPPPYSHKTLSADQKETLRRWIEQGAQWKDHWSFTAPVQAPLPAVKNAAWVKTPVDRFILSKLDAAGLQPNAEADRRVLIRRVTFDLTGLPPTPSEVSAFVNDKSPNAYSKVVERLLASPSFGEHRGRYWLDAARYADTQGLHIDNYREMWPYRDWVIKAFNRNMPFDQFTVEQLAGDLLPNATLDQRIASGFQRCNITTNEGGAIPAEVEAMYAKDRADTTSAVWLGLTTGCATCHNHKFDPIAQKEHYQLTAFFRNTTQLALDGNVPDTPPTVVVPRPEDWQRWSELSSERDSIRQTLAKLQAASDPAFDQWSNKAESSAPPSQILHWGDGVRATSTVAAAELPNVPLSADKPFTVAAWIYVPKEKGNFTIAKQSDPGDGKHPGWSFGMNGGQEGVNGRAPDFRLIDENGKFIAARPASDYQLQPENWYHILYTYDGSRSRKGLSLYVNGAFVPTFGTGEDNNPLPGSISNAAKLKLAGLPISDFQILSTHSDEVDAQILYAADKRLVYTYAADPKAKTAVARLREVDAERYRIARRGAVTFVMQERAGAEPTAHILNRGQYDQPREEVHPGVPAVLPPMSASLPRNRLGLAKWLVDPANPLTARVTVNRFWQEVFGTGLVKTTEDFGSQGEPPSHPELLDWLAIDFRDSGWDVKRLFRLMVTSAAYRQSAAADADKLNKDPDNRLLSRGPRFRMDAEMVRDCALSVSGLLRPDIGGPSVKPYQPARIWETVAMDQSNTRIYKQDEGDKLYRRSLYTFWKRSAPPPSMDIFNAPSRETCVVRRERTNTPLQALVTMNDPQFVEAARTLAQHALEHSAKSLDGQLDFMAGRLLARELDAKERVIVTGSYKDFLVYYDTKPADAEKLLSVGDSKANAALSKPQFAALTMVANELMNLDEVLAK